MKKHSFYSFLLLPVFFASSFAALPLSCSISQPRDGGVFKSDNRGEVWQQKAAISNNRTIAANNIQTITIDPKDSKIIYLGMRAAGLYKSMDGAETWYSLATRDSVLNNSANVYDIAVDPQNTANVYAATYQDRYGRLFRSRDAGKTWEEVYRVSREKYAVFAVEVDPFNPSTVYMATAEGGLLKSMDFGKSWTVISWFNDVLTDLKINPHNGSEVYASTYSNGIYKTGDQGRTWRKLDGLNSFSEANGVQTLVMDNKNPNVLYTGSQTGLLKSSDGGNTWQRVPIVIPPNSIPIRAVALDPFASMSLYYSAGNVIYRSDDNGQSWTVHPINTSRYIKIITIDRSNSNVVYVGMSNE